MLRLLQQVRQETGRENLYLGENDTPQMRAAFERLPPQAHRERLALGLQLGRQELRLGRTEQAIDVGAAAVAAVEALGDDVTPEGAAAAHFDLGVAWMRLGETQNCCQRADPESCVLPIRGGGVHQRTEGSTRAIECFARVLEIPGDERQCLRARWLLNLAHMTLGTYPDGVPQAWRIDPRAFASDEPFPRFRNVAPALGIAGFDLAGGAIAEDFDGDELLDLIVSTSDTAGPMRCYRNRGEGTFEERTSAAGLAGLYGGLNMIQADYDGDGDADVLVLRGGWWREHGRHPKSLLQNDGHGVFRDVTFAAGLGEVHHPTQTADWADYDRDGDLDLYVGHEWDPGPVSNQLFRNQGDGTFVDVAAAAGVENGLFSKAVVFGDYDGDGFEDLYVANMGGDNRLYHNDGDGTFTDVAPAAKVTRPYSSFPSWFWDFDNDGALDIFAGAYGGPDTLPDVADVAASHLGLPHLGELACLYRGDGRGGFREVAAELGLRRYTLPMGSNFGDLDNDGFLDVYLGTGYPYYEGLMPNVMYRNRGGTGFADVTAAGGFGHLQKGHAVVFADLDNDGDQDVFEQLGGAYPGDAFADVLFENPGNGKHWIKVRLVGTRSNRGAIGARLRLEIDEGAGRRSIYRCVGTGGSFGGNPLRQEIGLGSATRVALLEVLWPATGETQRFEDVPADRMIEVTEGARRYRVVPLRSFSFAAGE